MRRPSPEILDLFYRSGGYPIDDFDVRNFVQHTTSVMASTWFVPTRTIPAIFFIMGGGSGDLSAIIYELRRLADITSLTASALNWPESKRTIARGLCYHYYVQVTHLDSRIYSKSVEVWNEELTPLLHTAVLHPWFQPSEHYEDAYRVGYIQAINLPIINFDSTEEADFLGDPDAPVAKVADIREMRAAMAHPGVAARFGGADPNDRGRVNSGPSASQAPANKIEAELDAALQGGAQAVPRLSDMRLSKEDRAFLDLPEVEDDL